MNSSKHDNIYHMIIHTTYHVAWIQERVPQWDTRLGSKSQWLLLPRMLLVPTMTMIARWSLNLSTLMNLKGLVQIISKICISTNLHINPLILLGPIVNLVPTVLTYLGLLTFPNALYNNHVYRPPKYVISARLPLKAEGD